MQRLLITGAGGFVGAYASEAFAAAGFNVIRAGVAHQPLDIALDLRDDAHVQAVVDTARPDVVLHLGAQSFVPAAIADPVATYDINAMGTARLVQALKNEQRPIRMLFVSSAEVYGPKQAHELPITENAALCPANPYAASKAAGEFLALAGRGSGLEILIARSFNHIGPGQSANFVVAGFAQQLAAIQRGKADVLEVGNLEAQRDFLDVRDVVQAYLALLTSGKDGERYNVCSGKPVAIKEILRRLITLAGVPVEVRQDEARMRPSDVPCYFGDASKVQAATGWQPQYTLDQALAAILLHASELVQA